MSRSFFMACAMAAVIAGASAGASAAKPAHSTAAKPRDWTQVVNATPAGGFVMGNPNAKVKLLEFGSMTCPHCQRFDQTGVPQLVDKYVRTGAVSWEFRNYVRDAVDISASLLTRCNGVKSFFPLTRALYKEQPAWEAQIENAPQDELTKVDDLPISTKFIALAKLSGLAQLATARGLPPARSAQCLSNEASVERLVKMTGNATTEFPDMKGTPTFAVNGKIVELGRVTEAEVWPALEAKIRAALGERS